MTLAGSCWSLAGSKQKRDENQHDSRILARLLVLLVNQQPARRKKVQQKQRFLVAGPCCSYGALRDQQVPALQEPGGDRMNKFEREARHNEQRADNLSAAQRRALTSGGIGFPRRPGCLSQPAPAPADTPNAPLDKPPGSQNKIRRQGNFQYKEQRVKTQRRALSIKAC